MFGGALLMDIKAVRKRELRTLTSEIGVYALCDLDLIPIYVGRSTDGIRRRVHRHLTSARSDVIANRQLDVWEISQVWAWPMPGATEDDVNSVETFLIHQFNSSSPLVNGKLPEPIQSPPNAIPNREVVSIMPEEERLARLDSLRRLPRQVEHLNSLFSHILEVKNNAEQRRMLRVHFSRLKAYYENFMVDSGEEDF